MRNLSNAHPKAQSIEKQNKSVLRKLMKKYKLVLIHSIREYQMTKALTRTFSYLSCNDKTKINQIFWYFWNLIIPMLCPQ